jgi:hypothetical protein
MSGDCDPREYNTRERHHGIHDREDEWLVIGPDHDVAARDESNNHDARERDDDGREACDREPLDRDDDRSGFDPRDVFLRDMDLPDGRGRELVRDRDRDDTLNGSESRMLATVGAFRVVSERDLQDPRDETFGVRHLEKQGLIQRVPMNDERYINRETALVFPHRPTGPLHRESDRTGRQSRWASGRQAPRRFHIS